MTLKRLVTRIPAAALIGACSFATMQQLSGPKAASEPERVDFPEAEALVGQAAADYARRMDATVLATYLTVNGWTEQTNDETGRFERSTGMYLFIARRGGSMVKGAEGEDGVCFQYNCSLVQEQSYGRWESPYLDCQDHDMQKVTCKSVAAFGGRSPAPARVAAPATQLAAAESPPPARHAAPYGGYRGKLVVMMTSGTNKQSSPSSGELQLIDRGDGKVEVITGKCHVNAKRTGATIRIEPGQTCVAGGTEAKDLQGTFKVLTGEQLDVSLSMTVVMKGKSTSFQSKGVLKRI